MTEQEDRSFTELIPGLPEDISLLCLNRIHHSSHNISSQVCKKWRNLIRNKNFYYQRRRNGLTRKYACFVQLLPGQTENESDSSSKPSSHQPRYGLSLFDPTIGSWTRLDNPFPKYPDGCLPLFSQVASTEGKLVVMGGWDPHTCKPIRDVFLYDFTAASWTQCADMPQTTSFFAAGASEGKVYVAGGHDENKNALKSTWIFDVEKNEWSGESGQMSEERDECEGLMIGSEFWVISGYGTETQGVFKASADVYDIGSGKWRRVEDVWSTNNKSPRGCVGLVKDKGGLVRWDELDAVIRVGTCGLEIGDWAVVTGSGYQGGPHGFYLVDKNKSKSEGNGGRGEYGKLIKIEDISNEFCGIVQSGCCMEI